MILINILHFFHHSPRFRDHCLYILILNLAALISILFLNLILALQWEITMTCKHFGNMRFQLDDMTLLEVTETRANNAELNLMLFIGVLCAGFADVDRLFYWLRACNTLGAAYA